MKSSFGFLRTSLLVVLSAGVALVVGGCQASPEDLCHKMCDCSTSCTDSGLAQCIDYYKQYQKLAEEVGCGDEFNAALSCAANGECQSDGYTTDCDTESKAFSACEQSVSSK